MRITCDRSISSPLVITSITEVKSCEITIDALSTSVCMVAAPKLSSEKDLEHFREELDNLKLRIKLLSDKINDLQKRMKELIVCSNKNNLYLLETNQEEGIALVIFVFHIVCSNYTRKTACNHHTTDNTTHKRTTTKFAQFLR